MFTELQEEALRIFSQQFGKLKIPNENNKSEGKKLCSYLLLFISFDIIFAYVV